MPRLTRATNVSIGNGGANSFIIGAKVVIDLAIMLQIPIAEARF